MTRALLVHGMGRTPISILVLAARDGCLVSLSVSEPAVVIEK